MDNSIYDIIIGGALLLIIVLLVILHRRRRREVMKDQIFIRQMRELNRVNRELKQARREKENPACPTPSS